MARRRHSNRRRRRGSLGFLYKVLSMLVICAAIVAALTLFFRVDEIVVTGQQRYTQQEIVAATGMERGDNLFLMNKFDVAQRIVNDLPYIKETRINRKLPDTLLIDVEECGTPLAVMQDGSAWLVSPGSEARGRLKIVEQTEVSAAAEYGVIDGCQLLAPAVGTSLALATEYAAQQSSLRDLLFALEDAGMLDQVDAVHLGDLSVLTMDYAERFAVELPYGADYGYKLRALKFVIENLETNQTGTIELVRDDGRVNFIPN